MAAIDLSLYVIPNDTPVSQLDCTEAFKGLTDKEKLYAHYFGRACWEGALICLLQTSPESPGIFLLFQELFRGQSLESLRKLATETCDFTDEEYDAFLVYAAAFFSNFGNYKSFGDTKFIPNLPRDKFERLLTSSQSYKDNQERMSSLWSAVSSSMYSLEPAHVRQFGFPPEGVTTYYSGNCDKNDAEIIKEFMLSKDLSPYNTRVFKTGDTNYELRLAAALTTATSSGSNDTVFSIIGTHQFTYNNSQQVTITVSRGDYSPLMARLAAQLQTALTHAANPNQQSMVDKYISSFTTGSVRDHEDGSRFWIKDKGPVVETYIGFIESYRDPFGVRGEYEGFVAVVNKAMSAKFTQLVDSAQEFLPLLPWPKEFEKDTFLRPDFTSLDVLAFGSSGIPAGINIPNYDEIRQNEGFKNVSLGNVLSAASQDKKVSFIPNELQDIYTELRGKSFEVQVGLHELLGHGSGKLFCKEKNGSLNFDLEKVTNPLTGEKISSWYNPGETWDTQFSTVASSYEECRAECVGIYLCTNRNILKIFGYTDQVAEDVMFVNWLIMIRAGLVGLEFYTPETKKWRQAHMQARYVILRVLMECDPPLVSIGEIFGEDGKPDLMITFNRSNLETVGKPKIGEFLRKLQIYKSMADVSSGQQMYNNYSTVTDEHLSWRDIVLARKMPRRMFVQPHTSLDKDGGVVLTEFPSSCEGIISSFMAQYPNYDTDLEYLWNKDKQFWK